MWSDLGVEVKAYDLLKQKGALEHLPAYDSRRVKVARLLVEQYALSDLTEQTWGSLLPAKLSIRKVVEVMARLCKAEGIETPYRLITRSTRCRRLGCDAMCDGWDLCFADETITPINLIHELTHHVENRLSLDKDEHGPEFVKIEERLFERLAKLLAGRKRI